MLEVNRGCNPVIIIAITAAVSLKHDMYGFPATLQKKPERTTVDARTTQKELEENCHDPGNEKTLQADRTYVAIS